MTGPRAISCVCAIAVSPFGCPERGRPLPLLPPRGASGLCWAGGKPLLTRFATNPARFHHHHHHHCRKTFPFPTTFTIPEFSRLHLQLFPVIARLPLPTQGMQSPSEGLVLGHHSQKLCSSCYLLHTVPWLHMDRLHFFFFFLVEIKQLHSVNDSAFSAAVFLR